jgi:hypothetical protein
MAMAMTGDEHGRSLSSYRFAPHEARRLTRDLTGSLCCAIQHR